MKGVFSWASIASQGPGLLASEILKCFLVKSYLSRVESAQFSEKIIDSGGRQKQAIELFGAPVSSTIK